jgi:hypothetical protein
VSRIEHGAICGRLDRDTVCVTGDRDGPFRAALESAP